MAVSGDGQAVQFSTMTLENARKAKVSMENFYENLLIQDRDRSNRFGNLSDWFRYSLVLYTCMYIYSGGRSWSSRWKRWVSRLKRLVGVVSLQLMK